MDNPSSIRDARDWTDDELAELTYMAVVEKKAAQEIAFALGTSTEVVLDKAARVGLLLQERKFAGKGKKLCRWPWHDVRVGDAFGFDIADFNTVAVGAHNMKRKYGLRFRIHAKRGQQPYVERIA